MNIQMRAFAKKKSSKKGGNSEEVTEEEPVEEPVAAEPEPVKAAPKAAPAATKQSFSEAGKTETQAPVDKSLFSAFSVGDVK